MKLRKINIPKEYYKIIFSVFTKLKHISLKQMKDFLTVIFTVCNAFPVKGFNRGWEHKTLKYAWTVKMKIGLKLFFIYLINIQLVNKFKPS